MKNLLIYADGSASSNPGPAGIGVVIQDERGHVLKRLARPIGRATNNQAEYRALIAALESALKMKAREIHLFLDSQLVVNQMQGVYKVRDPVLLSFYKQAKGLLKHFEVVTITHVPRQRNARADSLAKQSSNLTRR
ncbi:MAG: ribonuclease HI family protein [Chloroflexi bacterium]|nr:ribonuclease HI family protein [Chloroflexota bacterium]MCL5075660.1 ribonuclease HI family protein [Chloroflexota bacterium]